MEEEKEQYWRRIRIRRTTRWMDGLVIAQKGGFVVQMQKKKLRVKEMHRLLCLMSVCTHQSNASIEVGQAVSDSVKEEIIKSITSQITLVVAMKPFNCRTRRTKEVYRAG